ncbi:thiol:disulfide interchange protein DsbA/DsbL [Ferrimonas sediminicola]|uniref:Thiol:disulfide interchange protein n=1 Tax=Ferrimonas sediminicola TaxID=2569538 RepID=A0A4U1BKG9_9GAMM|nr:thiol:disulfide interchange protein DsbA/DsbL [Ferrimonas sediminicola]TKB51107.1 thiol:disulfide interchange protein DsbA/DsbL [Ferrimonas sediminicola]
MKKLFTILLALVLTPMALAVQFEEGTHYKVVSQAKVQGQPTVTEFFSFYCPHCYTFEKVHLPNLKRDLDPAIKFEQKHVDFIGGPMGIEMTKALAVMQTLKVGDKVKKPLFSAIHDARKQFATGADIKQLFVDNGVDADQYDKALNSFMVNAKVKKWKKEQMDSGIRGVPALIVNGKYQVEMGGLESAEQLAELVNYLAKLQE